MNVLLRIFFTWIAVIIAAYLLPGIHIKDSITALIVAAVLALLDSIVKPVLIFLTIPITIVTLGLFLLFINAFIVLVDAYFVHGFQVDSFWWALLFSIVVSLVRALFERMDKKLSRRNEE
ncbi:MAG: phage holin family protein [Bacteroidota bacterium]